MTPEAIQRKVIRVVSRVAMVPENEVTPETELSALEMDSLDQIECALSIEEEFQVEMETPELWRFFPDINSYRVFRSDIPVNASAEDPAVSPDGQYVAYTRRATTGTDVVLAAVENRLLNTQLTNTLNNAAPDWSPDGTYLVFVSKRDGNPEIYRMLTGGQEQINLSNNGAVDTDSVWQPKP